MWEIFVSFVVGLVVFTNELTLSKVFSVSLGCAKKLESIESLLDAILKLLSVPSVHTHNNPTKQ